MQLTPMLLETTSWVDTFFEKFYDNFIVEGRWRFLVNGLGVTLQIALFAVILGIIIGFFIAVIRATHDLTGYLKPLNLLCRIYLSVIRGTPSVIQLLILNFVIFASSKNINPVIIAIIAFGVNSGAYVAEIFRSGIMSVDKGQFEAGRSLGFNYARTMVYIIMPQAFKNVLPALGNEAIVLLKETAIVGYIALMDLTKGADVIRSRTFDAYMPLLTAGFIYWVVVSIMTAGVSKLERRLRSSGR